MKHYLLTIFILITCTFGYSATITPLGYCGQSSYFEIYGMEKNSIYEIREANNSNNLVTWITPPNDTTVLFSLPIMPNTNIQIRFRYNADNTTWLGWFSGWTSANFQYSECGALPLGITNFTAIKSGSNITIDFIPGDEAYINMYYINGSVNGNNWEVIKTLKPNASTHYSINIGLLAGASFLPIFLLFCKKRKHFVFLLLLFFVFLGCRKNLEEKPIKDYKFIQIETVTNDGESIFSEVKKI